MKFLFTILMFFSNYFFLADQTWGHSYTDALQVAQKEHKYILLNFSGSDWCGPCIRLHKEVFTLVDFNKLANEKLVLLNADFPRYKKNQLSAAQQKINDDLAERYNNKGNFPLTVLLDQNGREIKNWEGFPGSPADFIAEIEEAIQNNK